MFKRKLILKFIETLGAREDFKNLNVETGVDQISAYYEPVCTIISCSYKNEYRQVFYNSRTIGESSQPQKKVSNPMGNSEPGCFHELLGENALPLRVFIGPLKPLGIEQGD